MGCDSRRPKRLEMGRSPSSGLHGEETSLRVGELHPHGSTRVLASIGGVGGFGVKGRFERL